MKFEIIGINNIKKWNGILSYFNFDLAESAYNYCKVFKLYKNMEPEMFFYEEDNFKICYIYLKEEIDQNIYKNKLYHISSPYCYGGFLFNQPVNLEIFSRFRKKFKEYSMDNGNVTEFIRFNPITHKHNEKFHKFFDCYFIHSQTQIVNRKKIVENKTFVRETYRYKVRKAKKQDELIYNFDNKNYFDDFYDLYNKSMEEKGVTGFYKFNKSFFNHFYNLNKNKFLFPIVLNKNRELLAAAIYLNNSFFVDYYLGASNSRYLNLHINHFLFSNFIDDIINNNKNINIIHYGGGNESLSYFKRGFSNDTKDYYIAKHILDEEKYLKLMPEKSSLKIENNEYFPIFKIKK